MERAPIAEMKIDPEIRELSDAECVALLDRNHVGRMAFSFHDSVDIRPIHYVHEGDWLFGRTSAGDKLITLQHNQWVAFEVDEISGLLDWQSVVVRGSFRRLDDNGAAPETRLYERALTAVRALFPDALTETDPVAFRTELFGIYIDSVSGRSCST